MLKYILLDLDNTIYPPDSGLWEAIGGRINAYMVERLGMSPGEVDERREKYLSSFGTTLNALRHYHGTDPEEFLAFVHDLPLSDFLRPDQALDAMLARLRLRKVIFTNADAAHARRVLGRLGILRRIDRIIDIYALEFINKPDPRAYYRALELVSAHPEECVFVDDAVANLRPARRIGIRTILVGSNASLDGIDHAIARILDLEPLINRMAPQTGG